MKRLSELLLRIIIAISICAVAITAISCKDDPEPSGPAGALGKSFNLAFDKATSTIVYSLAVSADGSKIIASMQYNNTEMYYSTDAGSTFTQVYGNTIAPRVTAIDNNGNILTADNTVFSVADNNINNIHVQGQGGDVLILGDNGKIFAYNLNANLIKQRNVTSGDFVTVTPPSIPSPGASVYVTKAVGKGLLYLEWSGTTDVTANAYLLDEGTLQWSNAVTFDINFASINDCNNLNQFKKFSYAGNNTILAKGCTGVAMLDLSNSNVKYVDFPDIEHLIYTDIRDNQLLIDSKKQLYLIAGTYTELTKRNVYRYNGSEWTSVDGFLPLDNNLSLLTADQAGNIYFNSTNPVGHPLKGAVKMDISSGTQTALKLPETSLYVSDVAETGDGHLLMVVEGLLYKYDIAGARALQTGLANISHINILPDGRWLAGGIDHLYLSNDEGTTWIETKNIFSSVDPAMGGAAVVKSRIVNNTLLINGAYHYTYYNSALGMIQDKYDNMMITFDGATATKAMYQFPSDFTATVIGPDGTLYGDALYIDGFNNTIDRYVIKPNSAPERQVTKGIFSPQVITDTGLQMTISNKADGTGFEITTRNSDTEAFQSSNTSLPGGAGSYVGLLLRQSGDKLVFIHQSEVYLSGN